MAPNVNLKYSHEFFAPNEGQIAHWELKYRPSDRLPTLVGNCPACQHRNEYRPPEEVMIGATPAAGQEVLPVTTRVIPCTCNEGHEQPEGVVGGCGRYWLARLTLRGDGRYTLAAETDISLLAAATALNAAVAEQDKAVQASAEKWTAGIAALYGLFSLTGIATAKDALTGMRTEYKILVAIALVAGIASAATALTYGYRAAFNWPIAIDVTPNEKLLSWYEKKRGHAVEAARLLRRAVRYAACSLAALTVMAMLIWFLPRSVR